MQRLLNTVVLSTLLTIHILWKPGMIAKHMQASFLSSLPVQGSKSARIKKLLGLINTCVLYGSSEEIFKQIISSEMSHQVCSDGPFWS